MAKHTAVIRWSRGDDDFLGSKYSRGHTWTFDGGLEVPASASPHIVKPPMSVEANVDPEEAFVAALSSCHMLWFLALAEKRRFVVEEYVDEAVGVLEKNAEGKLAMTRVALRPAIRFSPDTPVTESQLEQLHASAHKRCFIASSVKTEVTVEPPG